MVRGCSLLVFTFLIESAFGGWGWGGLMEKRGGGERRGGEERGGIGSFNQ